MRGSVRERGKRERRMGENVLVEQRRTFHPLSDVEFSKRGPKLSNRLVKYLSLHLCSVPLS